MKQRALTEFKLFVGTGWMNVLKNPKEDTTNRVPFRVK